MNDLLKQRALDAALAGLDYFVRNQLTDLHSADCGRYPFIADCRTGRAESWTTSWLTGIIASVMLNGHAASPRRGYLESAARAIEYVKSLQNFVPGNPRTFGALHEETPQDRWAHPRDGLSGALGLLDYAEATGDAEARFRAKAFADWFVSVGMEKGYPYWTLRFDDAEWEPKWYGSFHAGSAYFLGRIYSATGDGRYLDAALALLDFYNERLLGPQGDITVIRAHGTLEKLDGCADPAWAPAGWIMMHRFNDDFGALANLHAAELTGDDSYRLAARRFLARMRDTQRPDGGFGPAEWSQSIPNAAGCILQEMVEGRRLGVLDESFAPAIEKAAEYLLEQQFRREGAKMDGAFHGMSGDYTVDAGSCNARAAAYAIMSLLNYASERTATYRAGR